MPESQDIAIVDRVRDNPALVLTQDGTFDQFLAAVRTEVLAETPDLTTAKGRKAIAALAYRVRQSKTAIDNAGKELTEAARQTIQQVNEKRKDCREKLDALAEEVRKPLTEWEQAEEARQARVSDTLTHLAHVCVVPAHATLDTLRQSHADVSAIDAASDEWGDDGPMIAAERIRALNALEAGIKRVEQQEAERAELERLRREAAEREAAAQAERERQEQERREREAQERAERERIEAEQRAEQARQAAAEEAARKERERIEREHRQEQERQAAAHQAELDRLANEREQERREAERLRAEQAEREAAERRAREEAEAREADLKYRSSVMRAAKEAIMRCGVDEPSAKAIVTAIKAREIPNVSITF